MEIDEIKKYFFENKELIPLSFNDLIYKLDSQMSINDKVVYSEKYKDSDYVIYKFYKEISRLK